MAVIPPSTASSWTTCYELGRHPDDRRLVAELRARDADVARWWDDHGVTDRTSVRKEIAHPAFGVLSFGIEAVITPHDPEQRLVVDTAQPGSATQQALPLLASWAADSLDPVTQAQT